MSYAPVAARTEYTNVACDLSDVLGTPGIDVDSRVTTDLESSVGGAWSLADPGEGVNVTGLLPTDGALGAFGAFAPVRRELTRRVLAPGRARRTGGRRASANRVSAMRSYTGRHEVWQQTIRGAPVVGAVYQTHQGPGGTVSMSGRPVGDLPSWDPGTRPAVDERAVRAAMRAHLSLPKSTRIAIEPVVFPLEGRGIWAYKGECLLSRRIADLRIFVTADDLALLLSYDVTAARAPGAVGEGSAYRVSPSRSTDPMGVVLHDLAADPGGLLAGSHLVVRPTRGDPVNGQLGDYRAASDAETFNQVSAYYHCARALRWFAALCGEELLGGPPFTPLRVLTDDVRVGAQVAIYVPSAGEIRIHHARRNAARSADILVHEVTHAVADRIARLGRSQGAESRALGEGFADYVAATVDDDPRFGDYVRNQPTGARNCSDPALRFPADLSGPGEPYTSGAVWAAVLWDLRAAVGTSVCDTLVVNSLSHLALNVTFGQAVAALHEVDRILFADATGTGRHAAEIDRAYKGRLA